MDEEPKPEYDVGFGKPPRDSRFKKGQSGNPKGRPRGKKNASTVILRALTGKVVINENGRRREVTKFEAGIIQLANKAAVGDFRAVSLVTQLIRLAEERVQQETVTTTPLKDIDQRVLQGLMERLNSEEEEGKDA